MKLAKAALGFVLTMAMIAFVGLEFTDAIEQVVIEARTR